MMRLLLGCSLVALLACGGGEDGFERIDDELSFKLIKFGEAGALVGEREAVRLEATTRMRFGDEFRLRPLDTYYLNEEDLFGGRRLREAVLQLRQGDSVHFRMPYQAIRETVFCWSKPPGEDWPDTTQVEVALRIDKTGTTQSMLDDIFQEVKAGHQTEHYYLQHWMHARQGSGQLLPLDYWRYRKSVHIEMLESKSSAPLLSSGDLVSLDIIGRLPEGQIFVDSRASGTTLHFQIGNPDQVVPGLDLALRYLSYGEKALVAMPSEHAFGEQGSPAAHIPPRTPVIFEVEVRRPSSEP